MRKLKNTIKNIKPLYCILIWFLKFLQALRAIRLNVSSLREFLVWAGGGQELGEGNYRFYRNFMDGVVLCKSNQLHFIDIGANDGWFAKTILRFIPTARVTSYEPLISQHSHLKKLEGRYPTFHFRRAAVGEKRDTLMITEYTTSGLSSLKEISHTYKYSNRYLQTVENKYQVEVVRLDDEIADIIDITKDNIDVVLKIDVQGFELEVLRGAESCLRNGTIEWVIIELMTVEKYAGGCLYDEIFKFLHGYGYSLWDMNLVYYEPDTRRLTEFDAIFKRENKN